MSAKLSRPKKLLPLLVGLTLGLGLGEILTRAVVPSPVFQWETEIGMWQPDSTLGFRNKESFHGYAWHFIPVETNRLGFRGAEIPREKPPGSYRIVGLGDSVTWGVGVRDADTYLRILESNLGRAAGPARYQSVNTGVVGYSLYQELLLLERDGLPLCPDVVTLGYTSNDFYPTEDPFYNVDRFHQPRKEGVQRRSPSPYRPLPLMFLEFMRAQSSRQWFHAKESMKDSLRPVRDRVRGTPKAAPAPPEDWAPGSFEAAAWPVVQEHFRRMKRLAEQQGFHLLILLFHRRADLHAPGGLSPAHRRVVEFLQSEGIDHLDLFEALRQQRLAVRPPPRPARDSMTGRRVFPWSESKGWRKIGAWQPREGRESRNRKERTCESR